MGTAPRLRSQEDLERLLLDSISAIQAALEYGGHETHCWGGAVQYSGAPYACHCNWDNVKHGCALTIKKLGQALDDLPRSSTDGKHRA